MEEERGWRGLEKKKTERRTRSQIVTAEDQPSTQSQTGKGNAGAGGEGGGGGKRWEGGGGRGGCAVGGVERGVSSEGTSGFG